jgi:hypothetical protein
LQLAPDAIVVMQNFVGQQCGLSSSMAKMQWAMQAWLV